eukprot:12530216-Prorocentrum_lima.AAC.1
MTSSLVGSEMCIRDSVNGDSVRCIDYLPGSAHLHKAWRGWEVAHDSVSYTHLTLPTICSV